jgi:WD40 repeat protein
MAYNSANMIPQIHAGGDDSPFIWDYSTSDPIATVEGSTYFDSAFNFLRRGDLVRVTADDGKGMYFVSSASPVFEDTALIKIAVVTSFPSL